MFFIIIVDADTVKYKCPNAGCNREYKTKPGIYTHLKYECGVEPKFRCNHCMKFFKRKWSFQSHVLHVHGPLSVPNNELFFKEDASMI